MESYRIPLSGLSGPISSQRISRLIANRPSIGLCTFRFLLDAALLIRARWARSEIPTQAAFRPTDSNLSGTQGEVGKPGPDARERSPYFSYPFPCTPFSRAAPLKTNQLSSPCMLDLISQTVYARQPPRHARHRDNPFP